ncbi:hypothetical protein SPHINGOAX6_70270 [Sphingomonas sp. AX6]|nr:hypothetical protein SPHINGOAX6_70270 [Sphingomonas sp. AX6]
MFLGVARNLTCCAAETRPTHIKTGRKRGALRPVPGATQWRRFTRRWSWGEPVGDARQAACGRARRRSD